MAGGGATAVARGVHPKRACVGVAVALAALLGASSARADVYDESLRDGVAARDRARETENTSDWRRALELFERAVTERDTMEARFELAEAATELGQIAVAYESYELSLAKGLSGKAAEIASAFMAAYEHEVARLELVGPAGSNVYVNDERRAQLPLSRPLVVPAGRVRLRLVSSTAAPWEESVYFDAQVVMRLAPELGKSASPAQTKPLEPSEPYEPPGFFSQHPSAVALLSLAGVSLVAGGWFSYKYSDRDTVADDARHQIVSAFGRHVSAGVVAPDSVPCGPNGIASGAVDFGSDVPLNDQQALVNDYANACTQLNRRSAAARQNRNLALVSFGVGAVASAAVLTWFLTDSSGDTPPEADRGQAGPRLIPIVTANSGGLLYNVEF